MKITPKILSIPPYLSTTWKNVSSLHVKEERGFFTLIVLLQNRVQVEVPGLDKAMIDAIFEAHAKSAETESLSLLDNPYTFSIPLKQDGSMELLTSSMQHNPQQADLPPLPPEILKKIAIVARAFGLEDLSVLPVAEPNCNCMYCQVVRSLSEGTSSNNDELILEEDLKFSDWEILQTAEKLYRVTNRLDLNEHYDVFLGEPLGCTCGEKNCEHIRAVLKT